MFQRKLGPCKNGHSATLSMGGDRGESGGSTENKVCSSAVKPSFSFFLSLRGVFIFEVFLPHEVCENESALAQDGKHRSRSISGFVRMRSSDVCV